MTEAVPVLVLLDVDNTLLDNDHVIEDLRRYLVESLGPACEARYWDLFQQLRAELGYADYLGALQRFRLERPRELHFLKISSYLLNYAFAERLYPSVPAVLAHLRAVGPTVILSDGDVVFQPHKIERAGLAAAVEGRVLVYIHKERELDDVMERYPARHYVLVDDKVRILTACKGQWGPALTTVFVRQGHYAHDQGELSANPEADLTVDRIADLLNYGADDLVAAGRDSRHLPLETRP